MYTAIHIYIFTCKYIYIYIDTHSYTHVYMYIYIYAHTYIRAHISLLRQTTILPEIMKGQFAAQLTAQNDEFTACEFISPDDFREF